MPRVRTRSTRGDGKAGVAARWPGALVGAAMAAAAVPAPAAAQCTETSCPTPHACPEEGCPEHPTTAPSSAAPRAAGCPLSWADRAALPRPLSTDRPGNGNAATTVPRLRLQLETSVAWALSRDDGRDTTAHQISFPTALRFGVTDWLELRAISGLLGVDVRDGGETGREARVYATDTAVGVKAWLLPAVGALPDLALMVDVFLPSGGGPFTTGEALPDARLAAAWSLPAGFGVLLNVGFDLLPTAGVGPDGGGRARFLYVVNVNWTLPPALTDRLALFVEAYGRESFDAGSTSIRQLDVGLTFRVTDDLQLDAFSQHAFTEASPDHQVALGVSARF